MKRLFDLTLALIATCILFIPIIITGTLVKLTSKVQLCIGLIAWVEIIIFLKCLNLEV